MDIQFWHPCNLQFKIEMWHLWGGILLWICSNKSVCVICIYSAAQNTWCKLHVLVSFYCNAVHYSSLDQLLNQKLTTKANLFFCYHSSFWTLHKVNEIRFSEETIASNRYKHNIAWCSVYHNVWQYLYYDTNCVMYMCSSGTAFFQSLQYLFPTRLEIQFNKKQDA